MVRKAVLNYTRRLLNLNDTPERVALAFAVGVFFAFSPLLGLHTLLGLSFAFIFGLNRVAVLIGLFVNNPWTLIPIYAFATYVGGLMVGHPAVMVTTDFDWRQIWESGFWKELAAQWRLLIPLVLGSTVLSVVFALLSYPVAFYLVKHGRSARSGCDSTSLP